MAIMNNPTAMAVVAMAAAILLFPGPASAAMSGVIPEVEITLANDGAYPVWYMCQMTDKGNSLYELPPNSTYRFSFYHVAFPMRWCYLYINPEKHGFFWAYTLRSRCTKCFWSIDRYPSLYRGDKGRWERQKLFMPPNFKIRDYLANPAAP